MGYRSVPEKESEDATSRLDAAVNQLRDYEVELDKLSRELPEIDMALQKVDLDLKTGGKRIEEAERRVRDLK